MRVVQAVTDAGKAYIKPLGGPDRGPHSLACEWVGTRLADWFGLPVLDYALIDLTEFDAKMIRERGGKALAGRAFATRALAEAHPWGGTKRELENVQNVNAVSLLVIFDTWTLNWDRCPPSGGPWAGPNSRNVLLWKEPGQPGLKLLAIDHGECFSMGGELNRRVSDIGRIKDERVYGLFPPFEGYMAGKAVEIAIERLRQFDRKIIGALVAEIPDEWQVTPAVRSAIVDLVSGRAGFLADNMAEILRGRLGSLLL